MLTGRVYRRYSVSFGPIATDFFSDQRTVASSGAVNRPDITYLSRATLFRLVLPFLRAIDIILQRRIELFGKAKTFHFAFRETSWPGFAKLVVNAHRLERLGHLPVETFVARNVSVKSVQRGTRVQVRMRFE